MMPHVFEYMIATLSLLPHFMPIGRAQCNPVVDSPGICLVRDGRYALAIGTIHAEIAIAMDREVDNSALARQYLWLGIAYARAGEEEAGTARAPSVRAVGDTLARYAREAFREALTYDSTLTVQSVADLMGTEQLSRALIDSFEDGRSFYNTGSQHRPWHRERLQPTPSPKPPVAFMRLGIMSGWTVAVHDFGDDQSLALNIHVFIGLRNCAWGIGCGVFVSTGASPRLQGEPMYGIGVRPRLPVTLFLGYREGSRRQPDRFVVGVGADFTLFGRTRH
jgi:hypothetical protein